MPRVWLPNGEETLTRGDRFYASFVDGPVQRLFPRFLLGLAEGDLLASPGPLPGDYSRYVGRVLGLEDPGSLLVPFVPGPEPYSLVDSLLQDPEALEALRALSRKGGFTLEPFVQTRRVLRLAEACGLPTGQTAPRLVEAGLVEDLNDKGTFKTLAAGLGFRTVPGCEAEGLPGLEEAIRRMGREHPRLMLRKVNFAGGAGNAHGPAEELLARLPEWYQLGRVLVEPFLDLESVAGSLAELGPGGIRILGTDRHVSREGRWSGFDFPYPAGPGARKVREETRRLAEALHRSGARGYLNLDWAFPAGEPEDPVLLECNFRHNGFSYVADLAARYFGPGWERLALCSREALPTRARDAGELLARLAGLTLDGAPLLIDGPGAARGAVLTSPPAGGAFSVAIFASDPDQARRALACLEEAA